LTANSPEAQVHNFNAELDKNKYNLMKSINIIIKNKHAQLRELYGRLNALSPMAILKRGYSITRTIPDASIVRDPANVLLNQELEVMIAKGILRCRVKGKSTYGKKDL
jgi:exodeoxyribonuclease VII large subunit